MFQWVAQSIGHTHTQTKLRLLMRGYLPYKEGQYADYLSIHSHLHTQWSVTQNRQGAKLYKISLWLWFWLHRHILYLDFPKKKKSKSDVFLSLSMSSPDIPRKFQLHHKNINESYHQQNQPRNEQRWLSKHLNSYTI